MRMTKKIVLLSIIFALVLVYQFILAHRMLRKWRPPVSISIEFPGRCSNCYGKQYKSSHGYYYVMVVPKERDEARIWTFVKPFTPGMWCTTAAIMIYTALVVWLLEQNVKPPADREMSIMEVFILIWSAVSTMSFSQNVRIDSRSARIVIAVWLLVMSIIVSSYTENFTSRLNAQKTNPTITTTSLRGLISTAPIGYLNQPIVHSYLHFDLEIDLGNLKAYTTVEECARALSQGPKGGGVKAILMDSDNANHDFGGYTSYHIIPPGFPAPPDTPSSLDVKDFSGWFIITGMVSTLAVVILFFNLLYSFKTNPNAQVTDESPAVDQQLEMFHDPDEQSSIGGDSVQTILGISNISNVPLFAQGTDEQIEMLAATDDPKEQ